MTDKYAVIGNPIGHSKSPIIHAAFAEQTNQDISYEAVLAPLDGFEAKVRELIAQGYRGANVTVPFKFEAFRIAKPTPRAMKARAINTLTFHADGEITGDNTDGIGLVSDIKRNLSFEITGKKVLLVGSGGAAWGVLLPLSSERPASITMSNRTIAKAFEMAEEAKRVVHELQQNLQSVTQFVAKNFSELEGELFDIVINSTSTGLSNTYPEGLAENIFAKNSLAYEIFYGRETPFMTQAKAAGAQVADGLGMLVEQAAEAFYIWRGVRPQTKPVIEMLRKS